MKDTKSVKELAIEFAEWTRKNCEPHLDWINLWTLNGKEGEGLFTTEELYDIYLNKDNK